jgi:hypothetical protein
MLHPALLGHVAWDGPGRTVYIERGPASGRGATARGTIVVSKAAWADPAPPRAHRDPWRAAQMIKATVEYVGFRTNAMRREYVLRSHLGPEVREFTVGIALTAFTTGRVRFQDGPEICYLRLMRELEADAAIPRAGDFTITDAELAAYVTAHTTPARSRGASVAPPRPPDRVEPSRS